MSTMADLISFLASSPSFWSASVSMVLTFFWMLVWTVFTITALKMPVPALCSGLPLFGLTSAWLSMTSPDGL